MGITSLFKKLTGRVTHATAMSEPDSQLEWLDVDRVHYAIRSAQGGAVQQLFAIYRDIILTDAHIQAEFSKRKLAVLGDQFRVAPYDKTSDSDREAAELSEMAIRNLSSWVIGCSHLLDGILWPVSVVEKVYVPNGRGYDLHELVPVPHTLLDFGTGTLMIRDTDEKGNILATVHEPDPMRYIVHRGHLLTAPDQFGGPMRALIYWWLASTMNRDWWVRFLDRYGMPFVTAKYEAGNEQDKRVIMSALNAAKKVFGLAVTRDTEIEIVEASKSGADAFERFIAVAQREKSKLILGQTLSAQTDSTGLGSGVAQLHGTVMADIRQFDAMMLGETIRSQLLTQFCMINALSGTAPVITWGSVSPAETKALADLLNTLGQAGLEADDPAIEDLSERVGFALRRKTTAATPFSIRTFAATEPDVSEFAADVVPMLREFPAAVQQIIRESASAKECEARIVALYSSHDRRKAAAVLADALAIHAAAGATRIKEPGK